MILNYSSKPDHYLDKWLFKAAAVKPPYLLAISVVAACLYNVLYSVLLEHLNGGSLKADGLDELSPVVTFLLVVGIAPFVETLVFQYAVIEGSSLLVKSKAIALSASAVLFALVHSHSVNYILFAFVPGLLLGALYLIFRRQQQPAFPLVCLAHAFINLYSFIHNQFLS